MIPAEHLHPMILHFPIVLAFLLLAIDAIALWRGISLDGKGTYAGFSLATATLAGVTAILTMMAGDMALEIAAARGIPDALTETHEGLGSTTAVLIAIWAALRLLARWRGFSLDGGRKLVVVAVEAILVVLIIATAWFGGALVYQHGVNVAPVMAALPAVQ